MLGEAISPDSGARIAPEMLREQWRPDAGPADWRTWDGFFAAMVFDQRLGLVAGADLLGLFPFYHWSDGEVLLMASSPEPFQYHPAFRRAFDPAALAGIMLTNGLLRGRALWQDVHRLRPAHFLRFRPGSLRAESADSGWQAALKRRDGAPLSWAEQLERMSAAFERVIRRHAPPGDPCGLFLSGGMDSRLVAGYLDRQGTRPVALTLGIPTDIEMNCARRVARELGLEHRTASVPFELFPLFAEKLTSRWEHLANGGNVVFGWGTRDFLSSFPARIANGIVLDWVAGGSYDFGIEPDQLSFDYGFALKGNDAGFSPALLARLLRPEVFGDLVRNTLEEMRADHAALADEPLMRFWHFFLLHHGRFNAGSAAWHLSFGSWPVMISLDRDLFTSMLDLPLVTLEDRKAEQALLCREFPALARLPLDRNGYLTTPLMAGRVRRLVDRFPSYFRTRWVAPRTGLKHERRYFYRIYDLNNEGWTAVRRLAEPWRDGLKALFVPEVLDEILPPPDQTIRYRGDLIAEGSKLKQLLILALWTRDHL
ncbi:MAG: asparagine synthase-related protein [Thermoanaerobaculaceae bacterium]